MRPRDRHHRHAAGRVHAEDAHARSGHVYRAGFVDSRARDALLAELSAYVPIWESRYAPGDGPRTGVEARGPGDYTVSPRPSAPDRMLLRPVYWLGSWQFACLDYYRPPRSVENRCVRAEGFAPVLAGLVERVEGLARAQLPPADVPRGWRLNTCLINYYGTKISAGKETDVARVGAHRDFEPGPVASVSFGERALIQFVTPKSRTGGGPTPARRFVGGQRPQGDLGAALGGSVIVSQWLDDCSLQIFAGRRLKRDLLHRVPRVDDRHHLDLAPSIDGFRTRRINLTLRWVPEEHVTDFQRLPPERRAKVEGYVRALAGGSEFWRHAIAGREPSAGDFHGR